MIRKPVRLAFLGLLCILWAVNGCPPAGTGTDSAPTVELWVEPVQMAGPDSWMKFTWEAAGTVTDTETNFGALTLDAVSDPLPPRGSMIARISLQNRTATVAHFTMTVRNSAGEGRATVETPVGATVNTAPHPVVLLNNFGVSILSGENLSGTLSFNAGGSWDEQDGRTGLQIRWDFNNDGLWDTDWSATLTAEHAYTRAEAEAAPVHPLEDGQTQLDTSFTTHDMTVVAELQDSAGLSAQYVLTPTVSVYQ